jgi:hypothetical protein
MCGEWISTTLPACPGADLLQADAARYRCFKDYQRLHDAILQHVCLAAPALAAAFSDEGAAQQVRAALASLYPVASAASFVTASVEERLGQLRDLARATLGICCLHQGTGGWGCAAAPWAPAQRSGAGRHRQDACLPAALRPGCAWAALTIARHLLQAAAAR